MKRTTVLTLLFVLSYSSIAQFNFSIGGGASFSDDGFAPILDFEPKIQVTENVRIGAVGKVGLSLYFNSFYADVNIKPFSKSNFYIGLGGGWTTFEYIESFTRNPIKINKEIEYAGSFIPSIGFQGRVDFNLSAYIAYRYLEHLTLTVSRVIGYKKD